MNEFIKTILSNYLAATTRTYLNRASGETLDFFYVVLNAIVGNDLQYVRETITVETYLKLIQPDFSSALARMLVVVQAAQGGVEVMTFERAKAYVDNFTNSLLTKVTAYGNEEVGKTAEYVSAITTAYAGDSTALSALIAAENTDFAKLIHLIHWFTQTNNYDPDWLKTLSAPDTAKLYAENWKLNLENRY